MKALRSILYTFVILLPLCLEGQNFDPLSTTTEEPWQPQRTTTPPPVARQRKAREQDQQGKAQTSGVSDRAKAFAEQQKPDTSTAPWKRVVYRQLSTDSVANSPLFYPIRQSGESQSLFARLFSLLNQGVIDVYEYEDLGFEHFRPDRLLRFEDFLDRFGIVYDRDPNAEGNAAYRILPVDIPSESIKTYYVKEEYYYDVATSDMKWSVRAICPVMSDEIAMEGSIRIPLFWVEYDEIQPFLSQHPIMLSPRNNAMNATLEDFFRLHLYAGSIVMTMGGERADVNGGMSDEEAQVARQQFHKQIEQELKDFETSLYGMEYAKTVDRAAAEGEETSAVKEVDGETVDDTARSRRAEEIRGGSQTTTRSSKGQAAKAKKPKTTAAKKSSPKKSSSTRSVRNRF